MMESHTKNAFRTWALMIMSFAFTCLNLSCVKGTAPMNDNPAYKLLKKSVSRFNEEYKGKPIDLKGVDLSGKTIKKAVLAGADLRGTHNRLCRVINH